MKDGYTYTKKDFVAAVCCVVFLVFNLGVIGGGARNRAKEALCLSNLYQWGQMFSSYANDYDGELMGWNEYDWYTNPHDPDDHFVEHPWVPLMYPYYEDFNMYLCPSATALWGQGANIKSPYAAWDFEYFFHVEPPIWQWFSYYIVDGKPAHGSYGKNEWVTDGQDWFDMNPFFRTIYVSGTSNIPLKGDSSWMAGFALWEDTPVSTRLHHPFGEGGEINRWNVDRHNKAVNMLFLDWSARKVGLRELWMLKWNRQQVGPANAPVSPWGNTDYVLDPDNPSDWPEWMRD
ncbi:MAG: hypothetical protein ACYSUK_04930 [Planctomycetota bacterium]|jgi:prepilin-type processing-associated H-X9-DG protein